MKIVIDRVFSCFFTLMEWVCRFLLGAMVIICVGIFAGRYIFHYTPAWGEPLSMMCLVWLCILSSSLAIRDDEHLRMTMLDEVLPKKFILVLDILTSIIIFCFAVFMVYAGTRLVAISGRNMIAGLNIPSSYMNLVLPISGIAYFFALAEQWRRRLHKCL